MHTHTHMHVYTYTHTIDAIHWIEVKPNS
jgi:hypothetical protein